MLIAAALCSPQAEHFGLDRSCDLNPATPRGLLHQTQIALLLGCLEVVVEDIVAQVGWFEIKNTCRCVALLRDARKWR